MNDIQFKPKDETKSLSFGDLMVLNDAVYIIASTGPGAVNLISLWGSRFVDGYEDVEKLVTYAKSQGFKAVGRCSITVEQI